MGASNHATTVPEQFKDTFVVVGVSPRDEERTVLGTQTFNTRPLSAEEAAHKAVGQVMAQLSTGVEKYGEVRAYRVVDGPTRVTTC